MPGKSQQEEKNQRKSGFEINHGEIFAAIVESSSDAIIAYSRQGQIVTWNRGACDLFLLTSEEALGKKISDVVANQEDMLPQSVESGARTFEHTFTRRDGQIIDLSIMVYVLGNKDEDSPVYGAAIIRDMTTQKQAEKEVLLMSQQLLETNKQLEDYAWMAAHDLKEPLRTMGTYAKLVHDEYLDKLDADGKKMLSTIYDSATNALMRIDDTLRYSSLNRSSFSSTSVDLNQVVKMVIQDLRKAALEAGAEISVARLPVVSGNREMLALLFQNLISNAIKFRKKVAPQVKIKATKSKKSAVVSVSDNGIGIDMSHAEIVFGMFKRLDHNYPGTGLGLSIAKRIVDLHAGRIWFISEEGRGTTFHIELPI